MNPEFRSARTSGNRGGPTWWRFAAVLPLVMSLAGCTTVGPTALRSGHADYNDAIRSIEVEQFLLNIVRLRYND